jgi:predicted Ser/Thr protein kinase
VPSVDDLQGMLLGGRYRVVKLLGRGGMGAVHVARDEQLGSDVAVKVVREALLDDPTALARFKREAKLLPELVHEHIVRAYGWGEEQGLLWIAMELLTGETLRQVVDARGRMTWRDSLVLIRQIASALGAAHEKGVVHRDLKPENVIVLPGNDVRLLDFGVARGLVREGTGAASMTGTGMMIGTPGYIAPEVILDGRADDPRSDLYALGVVWFELLTAQRPFTAKTPVALAMAHAHQPAPTPTSLVPFAPVPLPIEAVVMRLLAKDPEARPSTAQDLIRLLSSIEDAAIEAEKAPREAQPGMPTITDVRPTPSYALAQGTPTGQMPPGAVPGAMLPANMNPAIGAQPAGTPSTGMVVPPNATPAQAITREQFREQMLALFPWLKHLPRLAAAAGVAVALGVGFAVVLAFRSEAPPATPPIPAPGPNVPTPPGTPVQPALGAEQPAPRPVLLASAEGVLRDGAKEAGALDESDAKQATKVEPPKADPKAGGSRHEGRRPASTAPTAGSSVGAAAPEAVAQPAKPAGNAIVSFMAVTAGTPLEKAVKKLYIDDKYVAELNKRDVVVERGKRNIRITLGDLGEHSYERAITVDDTVPLIKLELKALPDGTLEPKWNR